MNNIIHFFNSYKILVWYYYYLYFQYYTWKIMHFFVSNFQIVKKKNNAKHNRAYHIKELYNNFKT